MKTVRSIISAVIVCAMIFSMWTVSFAQADPTENLILSSLSNAADWNASVVRASSVVSGTRSVIDFSTIDAEDKAHGDVLKYTYAPGSTMGGVVMYEGTFNHKSPNKKLSFDFYVYDNTIPYEIRLMCAEELISNTKYISQFNINYSDYKITNPNTDAKIGLVDGGQASNSEKASTTVTNKEWHKMEVILRAEDADYYIDGALVGTTDAPDDTIESGFNSFAGVQVVSRADRQANTVTAASGLYLDNIEICAYDESSMFYGNATIGEDEIIIDLSESIHAGSPLDFSDIVVVNTKTGVEARIGTVTLAGRDRLIIPVTSTLTENDEYLVRLPETLIGISQKEVHPICYFSVSADSKAYLNEDFEDYDVIDDNGSDVCTVDTSWYAVNAVNVKDCGEEDHDNVLYSGSITMAQTVKFGIKNGDDVIDVSKGEAAIEFDMKLVANDYTRLFIQPYSTIDGVDDVTLTAMEYSGNAMTENASQFCTVTVTDSATDKGSPTIQMRKTSNSIVAAHNNPNGNYAAKPMSKGEWHKIKITMDYSSGSYPTVMTYIDDTLLAQNTADLRGAEATNFLRGIRFYVICPATETAKDYFYIDNVKFSGPVSNAVVKKIRMYNTDGESFGPMASDNLRASADMAEIYFGEAVDVSEAFIYLAGGSRDIIGKVSEFDSANKKVVVTFDEPMEKESVYTLNVTGVKSLAGTLVPECAARFETNDVEEFIITDLKLVDESGNVVKNADELEIGDTVYVNAKIINTFDAGNDKTALVLATEYNGLVMTNANYKAYDIPAGTKVTVENQVPIEVKNLTDLVLNGCVWESFNSNKPLADMVVCD